MNNKKLLLFDFDGVIADSMKLVRVFYNKLHKKYGLRFATCDEDISKMFYKNVYEGLIDLGLHKDKAHDFLNDMKKLTFQNEDSYKPFNGIKEVLQILNDNKHILVIISSNHTDIIKKFLKKYSFDNIFKEIHGAEEQTSKVEKIGSVKQNLSFDCNSTFYIGDTVGDIKEGKKACVHSVATSWGYHSKEILKQFKPEFLFNKPADLEKLIDI
ncbi:HAD family hydrolase [bacterium]|nr:HAD family hydrolase [bacterium]